MSGLEHLLDGEVVCMPVDTVYGLVTVAREPDSVKRLYEVKGRERKPGTLIAASVEQLEELGFNTEDLQKANKHWPGPVSVILPAPDKLAYLHMGLKSLAVRIPNKPELVSLLKQTGPLATTSANRPGEPTVTDIAQAKEIFSDTVSHYVDGGIIEQEASKIFKLTDTGIEIVRR